MWVLALLSVLALSVTTSQRTSTALMANQLTQARFYALSDAVTELVMLDLLDSGAGGETEREPWVPDGQPRSVRLFDTDLLVTLENEGSRLNLNSITPDQLGWLIAQAQPPENTDETLQAQLVDAIIDWRDPDDLTRLNGAEAPDYQAEGLDYGPRNGDFQTVSELRLVLGMTETLYHRIKDALTVADTAGVVNQGFATPLVLSVIRRIDLASAEVLVGDPEADVEGVIQRSPWDRGGPLYRLQVQMREGQAAAGPRMQVLFRVRRGGRPPFELIWRRYGY